MTDEMFWAAGLASRLRQSVHDLSEETGSRRRDFFRGEITTALEPVPLEHREPYLRALNDFFPAWMEGTPAVPARVELSPEEMVRALEEKAGQLDPQLVASLSARLAKAGFRISAPVSASPPPSPPPVRDPAEKDSAWRQLRGFAVAAETLFRGHWKRLDPDGLAFRTEMRLSGAIDNYNKAESTKAKELLMEPLLQMLTMIELFCTYLTAKQDETPARGLASDLNSELNPDVIEGKITGYFNKESRCWESYRVNYDKAWGDLEYVDRIFRSNVMKLVQKHSKGAKAQVTKLLDLELQPGGVR